MADTDRQMVERCVSGRDLTEPRLRSDASAVVYAIAVDGTASLVVQLLGAPDSTQPGLTVEMEPALRPGRGLGGGAWCFTADETAVVYVGVDGNLWLRTLPTPAAESGSASQLTNLGATRIASSPNCSPDGRFVAFVIDQCEIHVLTLAEVLAGDFVSQRIDDGSADFVLDPYVEHDSVGVRWHAWNVPAMPWDQSRVQRYIPGFGVTDVLSDDSHVGCAQQPRVLADGRSICVRDDTGWLNVWIDDAPLVSESCEHAGPTWGPGQRSYVVSPDQRFVAFSRNEHGFGSLGVVATTHTDQAVQVPEVQVVAKGVHGQLSWAGNRLACLRTSPTVPTQVVVYDTFSWEPTVIAAATSVEWKPTELVDPEPLTVDDGGEILHARLYRAADAHGGLLVWLHGGPTDQWQATFMPRLAYWSSRGWNILVPDYRGSTGHGRAYQQALRGEWGVVDTRDVLTITTYAQSMGWGIASATVVVGGSAGGFTALSAIAAEPARFAAGFVLYPVTDLPDLAERSHRFERHYNDTLIGPLPEAADRYTSRSPLSHPDRYASTPLLLLHGADDPVVPVEQSNRFAAAVRAAGGDVELHVYEGEGHGFRQRANQLDEYERLASFLVRRVPLAFGR